MENEDRLRKLKWPTIETSTFFVSLVECYKIVSGINKLNFDNLFEFNKYNSTRANHPYKLYVKPAKCNPYKYYFPIRIVRDWNSLPGSIVDAGSLSRFMSALKRFLNIHQFFALFIYNVLILLIIIVIQFISCKYFLNVYFILYIVQHIYLFLSFYLGRHHRVNLQFSFSRCFYNFEFIILNKYVMLCYVMLKGQ